MGKQPSKWTPPAEDEVIDQKPVMKAWTPPAEDEVVEPLKKKDLTVSETSSNVGTTQAGSDVSQEPGPKAEQPSGKSTESNQGFLGTLKSIWDELVTDFNTPATQKPPEDPLVNAVKRGLNLADQAEIINPFNAPQKENIKELVNIQKKTASFPASEEYQKFSSAETFGDALKALKNNPVKIIAELTGESLSSLASYGASRMAAGAGMGAAAGSMVPGIGTAAGAGSGLIVGLADTSLALEYSSKFIEVLKEQGVDVTDEKSLESAFSNEEIISKARESAYKKSIPIAIFDLISGGIAGKIVKKPATSLLGKVASGTAEFATQSALGGGGELAGQLVAGEKVQPGAILGEMIGELGTTPVEVTANTLGTIKKGLQSTPSQVITEAKGSITSTNDTANIEAAADKIINEGTATIQPTSEPVLPATGEAQQIVTPAVQESPASVGSGETETAATVLESTADAIVQKLKAKEPLTPEEQAFRDANQSEVNKAAGRLYLKEKAALDKQPEPTQTTQSPIDKYDNDPKYTVDDLADELESSDNPKIQEAVAKYRADVKEGLEVWGGREDSEERETGFVNEIRKALDTPSTTITETQDQPESTVGTNYQKVQGKWQVKQADGTWTNIVKDNPTPAEKNTELAQLKDLMAQMEAQEPQNLKMSNTEKGRIKQLEPQTVWGAARKMFWNGAKVLWETKDKKSSIPKKGISEEGGLKGKDRDIINEYIDDKNGLSIDEAAEKLVNDNTDLEGNSKFTIDEAKDAIIQVLAQSNPKSWYAEQLETEDPDYLQGAEQRFNERSRLSQQIAELEAQEEATQQTNKQLYENERRVNRGESQEGSGTPAGEIQGEQREEGKGGESQTDASQSIRENGDENKSKQALEELNSLVLTHVPGLGMGQNQAKGMYLSTEEENRYATEENKPVKVKANIKKPFVSTGNIFYDIQRKIIQARFGKNSIDELTDTEGDLLAEMVNEHFINEGYDSIYFPQSEEQEGELIVFDRANIVPIPPASDPVSVKEPPAKKTKAILQRVLDSNVRESIKKGLKEKGVTYIPKGLDLTYSEAKSLVELYGDQADLIVRNLSNGLTPDTRVAMTAILYEQYVESKQNDKAIDIALWQAEQSLQAGRASNAAKIWKMITQSGQENIVLAIEKEQQKTIEQVVEPVREELTKTMADIEAEIRRQVEARVQTEVEGRLKKAKLITKEKRKEIADFFDGLKVDTSNKGMMSASVIPGITLLPHVWNASIDIMKQAVLTGADVANAIQAGIDYIKANQQETIDEDKFKEFMTPKLEAIVPKEKVKREGIDDDKIKVPKLTGKKKKEFIDKIIDAHNEGKLTDKKLEEIYAGKVGTKILNERDRARIRELAGVIDNLEKFEKELEKDFTPENIKKYKQLLKDAQKANELLHEFSTTPNKLEDTLISIMQGNLMSTMSLVSNPFYNIALQPLRFLSAIPATFTDSVITQMAKWGIVGKSLQEKTIDLVALQKGYFKGAWNGLIEGAQQLATGTQADPRTLREVQSNFSPSRAIQRWSEKDRTLAQKANDYIEGTIGWEAESVFRILNLGDKPWRRAAEFARAMEIADIKGLKGKDLQKFLLIPDLESAQKIKEAGDEATFQQQGEWAKMVQGGITNFLNKVAEIPYVGKPAKVILKSQFPFIKTPWNLVAETIQYAAPPVTFAIGVHQIANGNKRGGSMMIGKAMVGAMIQAVAYQLFIKGLLTGDDDKEEKKRNFQLQGTPPANSINTSALARGLSGQSWDAKDRDIWVSYQKMGVLGVLFDSYTNTYKERQANDEPVLQMDTYFQDMITSGPKVASSSLDQTFLQGTSTLLEAVKDGGNKKTQNWIIKTSEGLAAILYPNTIATISKATDEYLRDIKDESFWKQVQNVYKAKLFMGSDLPVKVSVWGDLVTGAPEGRSKPMYYLFDPTKFKEISTQDFRYKLYQEFKKDYDADWLPGSPSREFTVNKVTEKFTPKQYELLSVYVGKERADMAQSYINSDDWELATVEEKKEELKYIYDTAGKIGRNKMMMDMGYNVMKPGEIAKSRDIQKIERALKKMANKLNPNK